MARFPTFLAAALMAAVCLFLGACAPSSHPGPLRRQSAEAGVPPRFQLIYIVHGDAGYIYHDTSGIRHLADTDALAQARYVAGNSPDAEVFIFHQKPRGHWFRPAADGCLYHYRNGRLLREEEYRRSGPGTDFAAEAALFHRYESATLPADCAEPDSLHRCGRVVLYFGHEIPDTESKGYFRSRPEAAFSMTSFTRGLERFAGPMFPSVKPFSLIVLSACHGGTPVKTRMLSPYASYLLASPGELHLSFLDTRSLANISNRAGAAAAADKPTAFSRDGDAAAREWGERIAEDSFARLQATTQTTVTLALYASDSASAYLDAHREAWETAGRWGNAAVTSYRDCGDDAAFGRGGRDAGVTTYYRPPRFGPDRAKPAISGWECPGT